MRRSNPAAREAQSGKAAFRIARLAPGDTFGNGKGNDAQRSIAASTYPPLGVI
jgi:hypothetical protein